MSDEPKTSSLGDTTAPLWMSNFFNKNENKKTVNKLEIIKNGFVVNEYSLDEIKEQINIGRHPNADLQLEFSKIGLFHLAVAKRDEGYFLLDLGSEAGTLLNGQALLAQQPVMLRNGYLAEIPGFRLKFVLPDYPPLADETTTLEKIIQIAFQPVSFPTPEACPLFSNLIENRSELSIWTEGTTTLVVSDIIEETADTKTFRLAGEKPLLFSYKPGQFITLLLTLKGQTVQRSYSMSSSPSRPHTLDITVKRVPGGLVSNLLCDKLQLGKKLKVRGPSGKFTCFEYPSGKMLFIAAGSGITPIMSMARWITDTAANVDVKMLVSSKSPQEIIFLKELELMSARHSNFRVAVTITSRWQGTDAWLGMTGRITAPMIQLIAHDFKERHVFVCGPDDFMQDIEKTLRDMDFPMAQLHSESFGVGRVVAGLPKVDKPSVGKYTVNFSKSNIEARTDGYETILELAESHGVEIDYSCRIGACGVCMVKAEGETNVSSSCEIDDKDKSANFIYACCTKANGDLKIEA